MLAVVASWRGASELVWARRELARVGVLEPRMQARRVARIDRALDVRGLARSMASVSIGSVRGADVDVDDIGLLEGAMRRAARERMAVSSTGVSRTAAATSVELAPTPDWGSMLVDERAATTRGARGRRLVTAWPVASIALGMATTFVPLVRPLADGAPWLALAGASLVLAGVLARGRSSADVDEDRP
ncbi:MAG: hypothetical protein JWM86_1567 [Thermoleophilia bacterium]|nr:hypothetical protein [Thermoleophilia bacterium]